MQNKTVYIIDDEPTLLELLAKIVEVCNMKAETFLRAKDFFGRVTHFQTPSILVLDLQMPDMDGVEVMRRLSEMPNPPPLILISGYDKGILYSAEKLGIARNLNILTTLEKPISIDGFQRIILQQFSQNKKDSPSYFSPYKDEKNLQQDLLRAIEQNEFYLDYQPQYELQSMKLLSAEALIRWAHPVRGTLYPAAFIPFAEKSGFITKITHCIIEHAVQQEQLWKSIGISLRLAINVSPIDISSLTLPEQISEILSKREIDPKKLILEITENSLMKELTTSLDILTRLRLKGIGLSIDDFGTGYSSLSQLHRIPFTELKIDRSFVSKIHNDSEARAIVKTCIMLGQELNMKTVAEGVEKKEHLYILKDLGCDIVQGFYLNKPLSAENLATLLKN